MNALRIPLDKFPLMEPPTHITVACVISRCSNILAVSFELLGNMEELAIPMAVDIPARKKYLWEETCLELFLGLKDSPRYWEFNLSPAGHWNVFRFDAYREGMQEEGAFPSLPFRVQNLPGSFLLAVEIDLDRIIEEGKSLDAGISAVVKKRDGGASYWSLTHPGPRPDFHRRESFIVEL
jgi:hypothetical protein